MKNEITGPLKNIISHTEGKKTLYKQVPTLKDAIDLIANISYSACDSMSYAPNKIVDEIIKTIALNNALDKAELFVNTNKPCGAGDEVAIENIANILLADGKIEKELKDYCFQCTRGDVGYGWVGMHDNSYYAYVSFPREGSLITNAEAKGMEAVPAYEKAHRWCVKKRFSGDKWIFHSVEAAMEEFRKIGIETSDSTRAQLTDLEPITNPKHRHQVMLDGDYVREYIVEKHTIYYSEVA